MTGIPKDQPEQLDFVEVNPALTCPQAIVAGLLAAGHTAIARVADGAIWHGELDIVLDAELKAPAERMALLWQRTARHMQCRRPDPRQSRPHRPTDPARSARSEFRSG